MQTKNENNILLSDDLKDIIDLDSISTSKETLFCASMFNKQFSVLSYKESAKKSMLTIMLEEKDLLRLFSDHVEQISLSLGDEVLRNYNLSKDLMSFKIEQGLKNIYKVKISLKKEID